MNNINKIVKESGINFLGSVVGLVLNYGLLMILTHFLSPDQFGTFVLAQSVISIFLIFVLFGTPKALDRFIPFYNAEDNKGKVKSLIYMIIRVTFILSLMIGILLFFGAKYSSHFLPDNPIFPSVLRVMVLSIPLLAFIQIVSSVFIGFKELRYQVYIRRVAFPLFEIIFAIVVFLLGYNLLGWIWAYILSLTAASALAFWFFKKRILISLSTIKKLPISFKEVVTYSWPLSINNVILILLGQIGIIFLGFFRSPEEVGAFKVYVYLVSFLGLILSSFAQIYKPVISENIAKHQYNEVNLIYKRVSKWIFIINSFMLLILLLLGTSIVKVLFTKEYLLAPTALYILATGTYLNSAFGPEGMTLEAYGKTKLSMVNAIIMLATNFGLSYMLIPKFGITGAAIASASSITIGGLAGLIEIYVLYRLQPFMRSYIKYIFIIIVVGSLTYLIQYLYNNLTFIGVGVSILFLTGSYLLGLVLTRSFDDMDRELLRRLRYKVSFKK